MLKKIKIIILLSLIFLIVFCINNFATLDCTELIFNGNDGQTYTVNLPNSWIENKYYFCFIAKKMNKAIFTFINSNDYNNINKLRFYVFEEENEPDRYLTQNDLNEIHFSIDDFDNYSALPEVFSNTPPYIKNYMFDANNYLDLSNVNLIAGTSSNSKPFPHINDFQYRSYWLGDYYLNYEIFHFGYSGGLYSTSNILPLKPTTAGPSGPSSPTLDDDFNYFDYYFDLEDSKPVKIDNSYYYDHIDLYIKANGFEGCDLIPFDNPIWYRSAYNCYINYSFDNQSHNDLMVNNYYLSYNTYTHFRLDNYFCDSYVSADNGLPSILNNHVLNLREQYQLSALLRTFNFKFNFYVGKYDNSNNDYLGNYDELFNEEIIFNFDVNSEQLSTANDNNGFYFKLDDNNSVIVDKNNVIVDSVLDGGNAIRYDENGNWQIVDESNNIIYNSTNEDGNISVENSDGDSIANIDTNKTVTDKIAEDEDVNYNADNIITTMISSVRSLLSSVSSIGTLFKEVVNWLPSPIPQLLISCVCILLFIAIVKFIRG